MPLIAKKSGNIFRVGIFLDFVWLNAHVEGAHGAYVRGPDENELTPMGVELNGSRRVPPSNHSSAKSYVVYLMESGTITMRGGQIDFVLLPALAEGPHEAHVWCLTA